MVWIKLKVTLWLVCLIGSVPYASSQTAFTSPCAAMASEIPFYLDPSASGGATVINPSDAACAECPVNSAYYPSATTDTLYGGANIPTATQLRTQLNPSGGVNNEMAMVLECPNACVCDASGLCAQVTTPMTNFGLYPFCNAGGCQMYFYVISTQPGSITGGPPPGQIIRTDGMTPSFTSYQANTNPYTAVPMAGTFPITSASCNGCTYTPVCLFITNPATCFSADTKVRTANGIRKRMDELEIGEWVLASNGSAIITSRVESWLHREADLVAQFVKLNLENGAALKLTPKHFIYKIDCSEDQHSKKFHNISLIALTEFHKRLASGQLVYAENVDPGDCVGSLALFGEKYVLVETRIINATVVEERGVYAPMTNEGNIIVEDVLASCMTIIHSSLLQRNFVLKDLMSWLRLNNKHKDEPLPLGTTWMLDLMKYVLPHTLPST